MKKLLFILILILFCSCESENLYKKSFEEKIEKDIKSRKQIVDYSFRRFLELADGQPIKYKRVELYFHKLNEICIRFIQKSLKLSDINQVNILRIKTLKNIKKNDDTFNTSYETALRTIQQIVGDVNVIDDNFPEMKEIRRVLNKPIANHLDKYETIDKVNGIYLRALVRHSIRRFYDGGSCIRRIRKPKPTKVHSSRLNDSLVYVSVISSIVRNCPEYFESGYLNFELKSPNDTSLHYEKSDFIVAYDVYTRSDTLNLKVNIQTNENIGLILTDDEKDIVVGEVLELKTNVKQFVEIIQNPK